MARGIVTFVVVLAALSLVSTAVATTSKDCPSTCLPPYANKTHARPSADCMRMCQVCLNHTSKGCTSYYLPYFYGNEYSKHFACWETCPMPTWAWITIGVSVGLALLLICHCIWYCAYRRQKNREAAMQMYHMTHGGNVHMVVEQANYPAAGPGHAKPAAAQGSGAKNAAQGAKNALKSSVQAVKNLPKNISKIPLGKSSRGPPAGSAPLPQSYIPPPAPSPATLPPNPSFSINSSRSVPRHDGGGWGVRTPPAYVKLEQAERDADEAARHAALNPYATNRI